MKMLRVIASMDPEQGGPCEGIRSSIPAQEDHGVQTEVLSFDAPDAEFIEKEGIKIQAIGPAKGPYAYCSKLSSWLKENLVRFDVVIIHGLWLYNSYGTYRIWHQLKKKKNKVPKLFLMPHGMLDPYFQKEKSRRMKAIRNWIFWKLLEEKVVNGVDGILFTCEQELLLARENFKPYFPKSEVNIGYGIKIPPFSNFNCTREFFEKCPEVKLRPYWLFLSRIHPKKGVDILIKAYLQLRKENKKIPDLVIAGPGLNTGFGNYLKKMVQGEPIYFPGMLKGAAKWGAFYGCEAFVLPSHQENFGIAIVEAMACGKPVLISNKVNIWKEIEKANSGLICKDTEEGVFAMLAYWNKESDEKKAEMGRNARELFNFNYSIEKAAVRMINHVSSLCRKGE